MKYGIKLIVASAITMALAYLLVRILLETAEPPQPGPEAIREAQQLRRFSNELVTLTAEFLSRSQQSGPGKLGQSAEFGRWATREYGPKINDLRQRMLRSDLSGRAFHALLAAGDRTAAMGERPTDERLKKLAIRDVRAAASHTETRIAALGVADRIAPQAVAPRFSTRR